MSGAGRKARDKVTLKNTRDGLVERNAATGEDAKVTKREAELDLRGVKPEDKTRLSQAGNLQSAMPRPKAQHKRQQRQYQQHKPDNAEAPQKAGTPAVYRQPQNGSTSIPPSAAVSESDDARATEAPQSPPRSPAERVSQRPPKSKPPPNRKKQYRPNSPAQTAIASAPGIAADASKSEPASGHAPLRREMPTALSEDTPHSALQPDNRSELRFEAGEPAPIAPNKRGKRPPRTDARETAHAGDSAAPAEDNRHTQLPQTPPLTERRESALNQSKPGRPQFGQTEAVLPVLPPKQSRPKQQAQTVAEARDAETSETQPMSGSDTPKPKPQNDSLATTPDATLKPDKSGKLRFTQDEAAPAVPSRGEAKQTKKLGKAQKQTDKAVGKLDKAKSKLPAKKKLRSRRVFNEESGKAKRKLYFENEVKSQGEHLKGSLPLRPVKAAGNLAIVHAHRKLYQAERENVATEAAHKGEIIAEGGIRSALRFAKTAPYRKVAKLERKAAKKSINLAYRKAIADNPKLQSNFLSRAFQKRKIKKDYAKAAREAKKTAERAKKAGSAVSDSVKSVAGAIKRHPMASAIIVLTALLLFVMASLIGAFGGMGSGGLGGILTASYLADDVSVDSAELSYTEWETDLQEQIASAEITHSGYDEYSYNVGEISHNPYELMAYLTVKYQNFTYAAIEADLQALFAEQYHLAFTPTTETRYADPADVNDDGDYEPYDWRVMTVTLTARNFSEVSAAHLGGDEAAHYALLLQTKGSRQYLANPFGDTNWLPFVTSYYGYRIHPISGVKDLHRGVDIGMSFGTQIHSGQDGTVTFAGDSGGYGNVVVIENSDGLVSKYAHCDTISITVGQTVKTGDVIATVGSTGNSTGPHLHLEIMKSGEYLNPAFFADTGSINLTPVYGYAGAPMGDGSYAALMEAALRFEDWPYVWGGSSPETSFDCSGLVSYCLAASGVRDVGRLGAQGLYNICTPVSPSEATPGDLIFFHSTYSGLNPVTHVGIFCGGNLMYDAGNPIGYTRIDTTYWQSHLYGYGRIN
jgi:murein DD-endopeptidase MepM/ murein hydrolase activator NlpD